MKKYTLSVLIGLLVIAMTILGGCGSSKSNSTTKEIVIGNLQDLSGPTSVLGNAVTRGVELSI